MINICLSVFSFFFCFLVGKLFGRRLGVWGFFLILVGVTTSAFLVTLGALLKISSVDASYTILLVNLFCWLKFRTLKVDCLLEFTAFSCLMLLMVIFVFFAVLLFSFYYMRSDPNLIKFFSYLSLFVGFMLLVVAAGNFVVLFIGWEGVGLSSFLLINFWTTRLQAAKSALKALLVNRIGDFFLLLAISFIYKLTAVLDFQAVFLVLPFLTYASTPVLNIFYVDIICLFLVIAAVSKSAQIGLHLWLPDAMEGPTPVSAMIHAATMVTAGLYLLLRCSTILVLSSIAMQTIFFIGLLTVLFASLLGAWQYDIKKIIAFSTCSQLGYIMTTIGSSYFSVGFFHLITHAFFKALLFLSAGLVIHAMQGEQDLRRLAGGFSLPKRNFFFFHLTQVAFLIGTFSIVGLFFFSGFYSKESILFSTFISLNSSTGLLAWIILTLSVFLTSYYSFRLVYLLFFARYRATTRFYQINTNLTVDIYATVAVFLLMFFSIAAGAILKGFMLNSYVLADTLHYSSVVTSVEFVPFFVKFIPVLMIILGGVVAVFWQETIADLQQYYTRVSYFMQSKYYYDNLINKLAKTGLLVSMKIYLCLDKGLLEWVGPRGIIFVMQPTSWSLDFLFFDRRIETSFMGFMLGMIMMTTLTLGEASKITMNIIVTLLKQLIF